ncbi:MAG: hypothetical protein R3Y24_16260 [Eubacteriales bacterium]
MASLTTTLCNIFFTTAKNVVKIIRQAWVSLTEASKILFINPDNYLFGERIRAVVKTLSVGASVVCGVIVSQALEQTPIGKIPVLGDIVQTFCGTLVSGIMSCTLLYFWDRNETINKIISFLDNLHTIETEINYFYQQANYFEMYAAEILQIDLWKFKEETQMYHSMVQNILDAKDEETLNRELKNMIQKANISLPWDKYDSFDTFMSDKSARMVFE